MEPTIATRNLIIRLDQISKSFSGKLVLNRLDLSIFENEIIAIIGPNGSGKSTLLRIISGLSTVSTGIREICTDTKRIGYVPDRFPKLRFTPLEYLHDMGRIHGIVPDKLAQRINELLSVFHLEESANRRMVGFSKGMLQKVNIMQAILNQPNLLLLDEPLSGLDQDSQQELIFLLQSFKNQGLTMVMICHEPLLIRTVADRVVSINQGNIVSDQSSRINQSVDSVIIKVRLHHSLFPDELNNHPGILKVQIHDGITTVHVDSHHSDSILRKLLQEDASIVSVNHTEYENEVFHFRDSSILYGEDVEQ
ncbi:ABC transporter ATP-binding protein [Alicyclobacillus fodiniaquatilis]|uniref:ABC transporter ATP-binding protein n=1 Tax=Alicyclobacillus fodiniaquatilis TaxID=1661150 RepID=A0ABW4JGE2_9BACL